MGLLRGFSRVFRGVFHKEGVRVIREIWGFQVIKGGIGESNDYGCCLLVGGVCVCLFYIITAMSQIVPNQEQPYRPTW